MDGLLLCVLIARAQHDEDSRKVNLAFCTQVHHQPQAVHSYADNKLFYFLLVPHLVTRHSRLALLQRSLYHRPVFQHTLPASSVALEKTNLS